MTVAAVVMVLCVLIAFLLPPSYRSSSTILIQQQEIPQELVMSTVTSYAAERIQVIQARVMSRSNLLKIIDKFDLYKEERRYETSEEILERITDDISLDLVDADVVDPRTGRPSTAIIAFKLSFENETPQKAQRVAGELANLYLNENLQDRTRKAEDTSVFFKQETEKLEEEIAEIENRLASFKQENADALPEVKGLNLQTLQRKENEILALESKLTAFDDRRFYLEGQLAQIEPDNPAVLGAATRLKVVEAEYIAIQSKYSDEHPDAIRMKRQIEALKIEVEASRSEEMVASELKAARVELAAMQKRYTADHPDMVRARSRVDELDAQLKSAKARAENDYYADQPDNPAYITLKAQLSAIDSEVIASKQQREVLRADIRNLEEILQRSPQVEREYISLQRDRENALRQYEQSKLKQSRADVAKQLESESKGERFSLIDPPALPEEPVSPNRPAIIILGFVFALVSGIGFALISDSISGAVKGARGVEMLLGVAPLVIVPYQMNMADVSKKKRIQLRTVAVGMGIVLIVITLIHFFVSPLDVLWFRFLRATRAWGL